MKNSLRAFATAVMFLTRLPVGRWASGEPSVLAHSTQYFPLVGALVGVLGALFLCVAFSDTLFAVNAYPVVDIVM